eukprot:Sspe_Gene.100649::Locus_75313_Transcript_1_1_Confidence_1.000_Length_865::g.100649::m.100649
MLGGAAQSAAVRGSRSKSPPPRSASPPPPHRSPHRSSFSPTPSIQQNEDRSISPRLPKCKCWRQVVSEDGERTGVLAVTDTHLVVCDGDGVVTSMVPLPDISKVEVRREPPGAVLWLTTTSPALPSLITRLASLHGTDDPAAALVQAMSSAIPSSALPLTGWSQSPDPRTPTASPHRPSRYISPPPPWDDGRARRIQEKLSGYYSARPVPRPPLFPPHRRRSVLISPRRDGGGHPTTSEDKGRTHSMGYKTGEGKWGEPEGG